MKSVACIVLGSALAGAAQAAIPVPETPAIWSHSGQFVVQAPRSPAAPDRELTPGTNAVRLEPTFLAVTSERIKQFLNRDLGVGATWRGKIFLTLYQPASADDPILITSELFKDSWMYHVDLPQLIDRVRFVRAMMQVLLREIANRDAGSRSAEIPAWLTEGLAERLLCSNEIEIILPPLSVAASGLNPTWTSVSRRMENPLTQAREAFRSQPPLSFEQLSWPVPALSNGDLGQNFRCSAQLFVSELLQLKDGPACLRAFLAQLPQYYNWQLAFFHAFRAWFQRPLDVEKWWALRVAHFTGRELDQTWTLEESCQKLEQVLRAPVAIRAGTNELPLQAEVSLETVLREWDRSRQTQALQAKVRELELLRLRVVPPVAELVDDYRQTLEHHLARLEEYYRPAPPRLVKNRDWNRLTLPPIKPTSLAWISDDTLQRLRALDARRAALRPPAKPAPVAGTSPP